MAYHLLTFFVMFFKSFWRTLFLCDNADERNNLNYRKFSRERFFPFLRFEKMGLALFKGCVTMRVVKVKDKKINMERRWTSMANVTKDQIVDAVAARTDMTKKDVEAVVEALFDEVTVQMQKGSKVTFTGFGAFRVLQRAERMGINPKTKERIKISAMKVPKFSAGKTLKEAVK